MLMICFFFKFKFLFNFKTDIDSLNYCIKFYNNNDNSESEISHFYYYIKTVLTDIDNCDAIAKLLYKQNLIFQICILH